MSVFFVSVKVTDVLDAVTSLRSLSTLLNCFPRGFDEVLRIYILPWVSVCVNPWVFLSYILPTQTDEAISSLCPSESKKCLNTACWIFKRLDSESGAIFYYQRVTGFFSKRCKGFQHCILASYVVSGGKENLCCLRV